MRGRLEIGNIHRRGADLPAHGGSLGAVVHGLVVLLRGRSLRTVHQMELVAVVRTNRIVADQRAIAETEHLAILLGDGDTRGDLSAAVAGLELIGIGVSLDGGAEILGTHQVQVLDVVRPYGIRLAAGGALVNGAQAVPGHTFAVCIVLAHREQDAVVDAGLIQTLADFIPFDLHSCFLLVRLEI